MRYRYRVDPIVGPMLSGPIASLETVVRHPDKALI